MSLVALIYKESRDQYLSWNSFTWCPACDSEYFLSEEEVIDAIDKNMSVYAECPCCNQSFYIETEDE